MRASKIFGAIASVFILFLIVYIALTKEGGYYTSTEIEERLSKDVSTPAQTSGEDRVIADLQKGVLSAEKRTSRLYASKCSACHGKNGEGRFNERNETIFPSIAGKDRAFILKRLNEYKKGDVKNPLMVGLLRDINDEDLKTLADEISSRFGDE